MTLTEALKVNGKREEPWLVQVFGDPNGESWEISVVRSNNTHGRKSWGWFDENKLLISHNGGPCHWPLAPGVGDKMIELAKETAKALNAKEPCKHEPKLISQIVAIPFVGIRETDVFVFECKHCDTKIKAMEWVENK